MVPPKNRNVFLFGAGVSYAAGIPLLGGFMDRLLEIAMRRRSKAGVLSDYDCKIFEKAVKVRESLDGYHGRAAFNDRNIEDILSILALGANSGRGYEQQRFNSFVRAIARTIDLECNVAKSRLNAAEQGAGTSIYGRFWKAIIDNTVASGAAPTIISLNYDLVLERALIATIAGTNWNQYEKPFPFGQVQIKYNFETLPEIRFNVRAATFRRREGTAEAGYALDATSDVEANGKNTLRITILKPHGSLNFPKRTSEVGPDFQDALASPVLMPPIFNKASDKSLSGVWAEALDSLRQAVNVVICGYSLPKTDMYMQFFLKAALGPNTDLRRIMVYDPALYREDSTATAMRARYSDVFSEQIRERIDFRPTLGAGPDGTFERLVAAVENAPESLLFLQ